jgi:alpha-L-rhamnosidase
MGNLNSINGHCPHPLGIIHVQINKKARQVLAEIELPAGLNGEFIWKGKSYPINAGKQELKF